jgi:hypothetical protein
MARNPAALAYVYDESGYFLPGPDFGCVHHSPQPGATPASVHLVTSGDYDAYGVDAAFTSKDKADAALAAGLGDDVYWLPIVVDPPLEMPPDNLQRWTVEIKSGDVTWCKKQDGARTLSAHILQPSIMRLSSDPHRFNGDVWAIDEASAGEVARRLINELQKKSS